MAVGMSTALADAALDLLDGYPWYKLHVGDPGAAGTANAAVETTRKQATWTAPNAGATGFRKVENTADLAWTGVGGTEDYTHYSLWSASTAGNFGHSGTITANAVTAGDSFTIPAGAQVVTAPIAT
jgi:hypothetical protein